MFPFLLLQSSSIIRHAILPKHEKFICDFVEEKPILWL